MRLLILIFVIALSFPALGQGDELTTVNYEGISQEAQTAADAVREVTLKATEETARQQVIEFLGEDKYKKNKQLIEKKIIPQSSKFIPFIDPGQATPTPNGFKVKLQLKVSLESLRQIVQSAGLLASSESPGTFVSLVSFTNKSEDLTYRWWAPDTAEGKKDLIALNQIWQQAIAQELEKKKFKIAKGTKLSTDEREIISQLQAQMFIRGEVRIRKNEDGSEVLAMKVGVYQSSDSRLFADMTRTQKIPRLTEASVKTTATQIFNESAQELAQAAHEAWQAGVIGSSVVQIAAKGNLHPKQLETFKAELSRSLRDLKNFKERKFSPDYVIFEADFKGTLATLSDRLRQIQLPSFQTEVEGISGSQIEMNVKARR